LGAGNGEAWAEGFGLFPVRNFSPFQQLVLGMFGDRAAVIPKRVLDIRVELAQTAAIYSETSPTVQASVKFETLRTGTFFRYGLTDRLEVGLEIPVYYRWEGFQNGLITEVERVTTGVSKPRAVLGDTDFAFNLTQTGQTLFEGVNGAGGLGDITLITKYQAILETAQIPALSTRFALKLPTGDTGKFFGSGHVDVGIGLAIEKTVSNRWVLYGNVNGVFPTGSVSGLSLNPVFSTIGGIEYVWSPNLSLLAQFDYYSSPYRNTGTSMLDNGVTEATAGLNYLLRDNLLWRVYAVENLDIIEGAAADYTVSTVLTYRFGH
jgi:hypothetical protein